jgi:outer membrane protein OmpA-like peptidoglycan-associated protein
MAPYRIIAILLLTSLFLIITNRSQAAPNGPVLEKGYYIVVAAYLSGQENFAQRYSARLNEEGKHSKYGFDAARHFYYVYLDYYTDFSESIDQMLLVRRESGFDEAWVRIIKDGTEQKAELVAKEERPKQEEKQVANKIAEPLVAIVQKPEPEKLAPAIEHVSLEKFTEVVPNPKAEPVPALQSLKNTPVFFSFYNAANGRVVEGEVEVIDADRDKLISKMKANAYLNMPDPKSKSGKLILIGNAFGYRKVQYEMDYNTTDVASLPPNVDIIGNYFMIRFDLVRLVKGDIATLFNVYFYNDAAVMIPESKYELNNLLQMMQDNPRYRVMLHGHTNGNGRGKIIYMGPDKDFFKITKEDVVKEAGSAKELSGARAQVIKDWLVAQGIDTKRIDTKAWGGARMLHDKNSQHARRNVRVEIEVLED